MSFDLTAISDPQMRADLQRVYEQVCTAEAWNDPRIASGSVGRSGKPEGRPPGEQQAKGRLTGLRRALHRFAADQQVAQEQCEVREYTHVAPDSIGGIETDLAEGISVKPYHRSVNVMVTAGRLVAKYGEASPST